MARIRAQTIGGGVGITPTSVAFYDVLANGGTIAQMAVGGGLTGTWALINSSSSLVALSAGGLLTRGAGAATSGTPVVQFTSGSTILQVPITATVIVATLPANSVLPAISPSGTPVVGVPLSVTTGTWTGDPVPTYAYQWRQVDTSTNISGATNATYTPVAGDVGHTLTCVVTATNIKGSASASAATTPAVISVPVAPVNTVTPGAPTGSATVGGTLTAQNGTWTGNPSPTFTYAWLVNGVANGSTGSTYVPVSGDLGATISVRVTGTNMAGSATATSDSTAAVGSTPIAPSNTVAPSISGNPWPSSTLTANNGTWAGNPTPTFTYQWKSGGTNIGGATSQTYKLASGDLGAVITVAVTGSNGVGSPATATSSGVTIVEVPIITATPASSTLYVSEGDSQTAGGGSQGNTYSVLFAGSDSADITYVNQAVSGNKLADLVARAATTGALVASHPGKSNYNLTVLIGTNDIATGSYYPSGASTFVSDLSAYLTTMRGYGYDITVCTLLPRTSGVTQATFDAWVASVNTGIKALEGGANCQKVIDFYANTVMGGAANAAADTTLYYDGLHPTQRGHNYLERAIAPGLSARMTAAVAPTIASASISGSTVDGQILTATANSVTGKGTPTPTYQWKRNGSNISAATNATYTLQPADVGTTITVTITETNEAGAVSATSSSVGPITEVPVPVNSVAPVISGTATQGQVLTVTNNGTWTNSPSSYTYVWKRDGVSIGGATASTYTLQAADVGTNITCAVTAVNNGGSSSPATSNSIGPIIAGASLLDALSASATAAYSTRKLRNAYAGSAIKVRRSSDNTTQDIGFDGSGNLDAAALATFVGANSGFIDTWYDQTGNANHLAQATTANQPRIRNAGTTDTLNSQPVIYFPTALGAMRLTRATGFPASGAFSIVALLGATTTTGSSGIVCGGGLAAGGYALYSGASHDIKTLYNGAASGAADGATTFGSLAKQASYVLMRNTAGTAYDQLLQNGNTQNLKAASYTVSSTEITVGNFDAATANSSWQGALPEVLIFASVLSLADLKLIDGSHSSYWGTTAGRFRDATLAAQTSLTAPAGYVVAASSTTGGFPAWQAYDQNLLTDFVSGAAIGTIYRQIPSALTATAYAISAGGTAGAQASAPKTWTFEGSNDGSSWTTLDTISTNQTSWLDGERRVYPIASGSRGSYTYHRLNVATSNGASFFWVGEIDLITS